MDRTYKAKWVKRFLKATSFRGKPTMSKSRAKAMYKYSGEPHFVSLVYGRKK